MKIWDIFDDIAWVDNFWSAPTYTVRKFKVYDPEQYDLTPKESYKKELAEAKEKEIERLEEKKKELDTKIKELKSS